MPDELFFNSSSLKETVKIGKMFGGLLKSGDVVLLSGELGAGKTTIAKAISLGIGLASDHYVVSPSYAIINEYNAGTMIYHFDLYRLGSIDELYELGAYEYFQSDGICLIEWGNSFLDAMPKERVEILLEYSGENCRTLKLSAIGKRYAGLIKAMGRAKGTVAK